MPTMRDRLHATLRAREYLEAALCCLTGALLFFRGPLLLRHDYHIPYDLEGYHLPLLSFIGDCLREYGQLPWWNPYTYMGEPFFGNVQAAMFYPATLPAVLAANALLGRVTLWCVEALLAAHVVWAGVGAYLLLRKLGTEHRASIAGAMIFCLGAFFASQAQHLGAVCAAAWLPWFLAALRRLEERTDWPSVALAAISLALMILAGSRRPGCRPCSSVPSCISTGVGSATRFWNGGRTGAGWRCYWPSCPWGYCCRLCVGFRAAKWPADQLPTGVPPPRLSAASRWRP